VGQIFQDHGGKARREDLQPAGPMLFEPQQTRVFCDTLRPTLDVTESRWAQTPCSTKSSAGTISLTNGFLQLALSTEKNLKEIRLTNRVTGEQATMDDSTAFVLRTAGGILTSDHFKLAKTEVVSKGPETAEVRVDLTSPELDVAVHYQLNRQDHFYHKWLTVKNKGNTDVQVLDATVSSLALPRPVDLSMGPFQELTYPVTSLEKGGLFSCLETIHWDHAGDALTYYPAETVTPGGIFTSEKATVGVFQKRGTTWLGMDQGVREWIVEYHARISPTSQQYPHVYCEGWAADLRLLDQGKDAARLDGWMARAESLGIRYMDGYESMNQAMESPEELVNRWVELADRHHINTGWWIDHGSHDSWGPAMPIHPFRCKLSPEAEAYFRGIVEFVGKHHLRTFHWGDFLRIWPCDDPTHGHLPGKYSIQAQGQRILKFGRDLRAASPGMALGADLGFGSPQYARYVDIWQHIAVTGFDLRPAVMPDIHLDRLNAEMNRLYQRVQYGVYLHPWFRNLNCVNHFHRETQRQDRAGFRYALLCALASAPQLTFNNVPDELPESEVRFTQRWQQWARDNQNYLKRGEILFDRSVGWVTDVQQGAPELLSGMAHICKDRGFVFLMNASPREQVADLELALDAPPDARFAAQEVYPGGMALKGPAEGLYPQGGKLRVTVPGRQIRILWIAPAATASENPPALPEDARVAAYRRYLDRWTIAEKRADAVVLKSQFQFPSGGGEYLTQSVPEANWQKEPGSYDKAYLVLFFKDERMELNDHWIPDSLYSSKALADGAGLRINGVPKRIIPFKTKMNQLPDLARCYFAELSAETKPGAVNEIEIVIPPQNGLMFSGAYLDLPDQMPLGEDPSKPRENEPR
jgi:hypothetical protein